MSYPLAQLCVFGLVLLAGCVPGSAVRPHKVQTLGAGAAGSDAGFVFENGQDLQVFRPAQPLTYSDGLPAKRAAMAMCAAARKRLNPAAFGHFTGTGWRFAGGCQ